MRLPLFGKKHYYYKWYDLLKLHDVTKNGLLVTDDRIGIEHIHSTLIKDRTVLRFNGKKNIWKLNSFNIYSLLNYVLMQDLSDERDETL